MFFSPRESEPKDRESREKQRFEQSRTMNGWQCVCCEQYNIEDDRRQLSCQMENCNVIAVFRCSVKQKWNEEWNGTQQMIKIKYDVCDLSMRHAHTHTHSQQRWRSEKGKHTIATTTTLTSKHFKFTSVDERTLATRTRTTSTTIAATASSNASTWNEKLINFYLCRFT